MTLSYLGLKEKTEAISVTISVSPNHPLIKLAQKIPWEELAEIVVPDLKKTLKGRWTTGRILYLRNHLAAHLLQKIYDKKDRNTDWECKDNAAFMIFCGYGLIDKWTSLDHTSISKFRKKLTPETHLEIANLMAKLGVDLGYGDASMMDQDSTIQEANASYPADISLMTKAAVKVVKIATWLKKNCKNSGEHLPTIDLKGIKKKAREYFFSKKKKEEKDILFKNIYEMTLSNLQKPIEQLKSMTKNQIEAMPWNIKNDFNQMKNGFTQYMKSVLSFIESGKIDSKKILSWHLSAISCFNKGKAGNKLEFGRCIQLGRIGGNFAIVGQCTDVRMEDKKSISSVISEHIKLFGEESLKSFGADKGYYSKANQKYLWDLPGLTETGIQRPGITFDGCLFKEEEETYQKLVDRRSSVEGMIGHIKHGGQLKKSRMKSDQGTLSACYGSVTGYNLRCLIRHMKKS